MPSHQWTGAPEQWTVSIPYRPSAPRRFGSALLVGAAITGGVAASAGTASADTKPESKQQSAGIDTQTSIENGKKATVKPNSKVTFSGSVSAGKNHALAGREIDLQWRVGDGPWHLASKAKTDENGHAALSATAKTSAQWRLSFPGEGLYANSFSETSVVYTQKPKPPKPPINQRIVSSAAAQHGKPYSSGGTGPSSFDCSGLTQFVHKTVGIKLPRTSQAQRDATRGISRKDLTPGDLLFFSNGGHVYHTAVYAGGNQMWTAPESGDVVKKQKIWSDGYTVGRAWS